MATNTYVALNKVTVSGTSTTSVTLSAISEAYTDLRLVISSQNQNSTNQPYIQFNADTGTSTTNYSTTSLRGDGSPGASSRHTSNFGWYPVPGPGVGPTGNFQPWLVDIMGYSNTTTFKSGISRFNNAASIVTANAHLWRSTAAITSITITAEAGAGYLVPGSTFSLYGIKAWADETTPKATGGNVYSDSTYYYHAFPFTGVFTPSQSLTADVLVLSGGGSAGYSSYGAGGGGGAGGISFNSLQSFASATTYTMTVGAGGAASTGNGSQGNASSCIGGALSFSVVGGGGGGGGSASPSGTAGGNGANGGGSQGNNQTGGTGSVGFNGGSASNDSNRFASGGGGGMGGVGGNATGGGAPASAGNGGVGVNTYSSWSLATNYGQNVNGTYYLAGGGGGGGDIPGTGGSGGGGSAGNSGISGLGGGGGARSGGVVAGSGGSGLIVVRYAK